MNGTDLFGVVTAVSAQYATLLGMVISVNFAMIVAIWTFLHRTRIHFQIAAFAVHPGGRKVLDVAGEELGLSSLQLGPSRSVLHDHGNMSSATILFVLDRVMAAGLPKRTVLAAMGPGFSCGALSLARAA